MKEEFGLIDPKSIIDTIRGIKADKTSLDLLIEFARLLDKLHIFAYKDWEYGEVIKGPVISRYWVEVTLMYPSNLQPEIDAPVARLNKHGCYVYTNDAELRRSMKIPRDEMMDVSPEFIRKNPKKETIKVKIIRIVVPKYLLDEDGIARANILDSDVNVDAILDAFDKQSSEKSAGSAPDSGTPGDGDIFGGAGGDDNFGGFGADEPF